MSTNITKKEKESLLFAGLTGFIGLFLLLLVLLIFISSYMIYDEVEHLRAAYYVSLGHLPYRDFFEHHHPLLWYIWSPFMFLLPHQTFTTLYITRAASLLVSLLTGVYIYKIEKKFIGGKVAGLICLCLYLASFRSLQVLAYVKPDTYMRLFYFAGLFYLFKYFHYQKLRYLNFAIVAFFIGFCFLQTVVLQLLPLVLICGCFLYRHRQAWPDFIKAGMLGLGLSALAFGYLYQQHILADYFTANWLFNAKLTPYLTAASLDKWKFIGLFIDMIIFAFVAVLWFVGKRKNNFYLMTITILFVAEFIQRLCGYVTYLHYLTFMLIYAAIIIAAPLARWLRQYKTVLGLFFIWLGFKFCLQAYSYAIIPHNISFYDEPEYKCAGLWCGIYQPHTSYYWMYPSIEAIHHIFYNTQYPYNLNQLIKTQKPQLLPNQNYSVRNREFEAIEKMYQLTPEQQKILQNHIFDTKILQNYDEIAPNVYRLKSTRP